MDVYVGFLSYTNDTLIEQHADHDISMLDETVLNALDIHHLDRSQLNASHLTPLELLVEDQKRKRKFNSANITKRISGGNLQIMSDEYAPGESPLNTSVPETFEVRKFEDKLNESRPAE